MTVYDAGEQDDFGYLAMELLDGLTLKEWRRKDNLLPAARLVDIISQVAEALDYAHSQGVVHRDIKPANIMVLKNRHVKVMDFGIARITSFARTQTTTIMGTPGYMSPEQVAGEVVDGRSDLFSLGVILFELLTGDLPFRADNIPALLFKIAHETPACLKAFRSDLTPDVQIIMDRILHKLPAQRYQQGKEFAQELQAALQRVPAYQGHQG